MRFLVVLLMMLSACSMYQGGGEQIDVTVKTSDDGSVQVYDGSMPAEPAGFQGAIDVNRAAQIFSDGRVTVYPLDGAIAPVSASAQVEPSYYTARDGYKINRDVEVFGIGLPNEKPVSLIEE